jgi:hypothetical protein
MKYPSATIIEMAYSEVFIHHKKKYPKGKSRKCASSLSFIKENRTERREKSILTWFFLYTACYCRHTPCFLLLSTIKLFWELRIGRKRKKVNSDNESCKKTDGWMFVSFEKLNR